VTPPGGFFLWLDVSGFGGGEDATIRLWEAAGVRVLPGAYLSADAPDGANPGADYIRIALVEAPERTDDALSRLSEVLS
jgi:aspartate/methionine/tyrosine aminotransferase